jgi:hypothetical protein
MQEATKFNIIKITLWILNSYALDCAYIDGLFKKSIVEIVK